MLDFFYRIVLIVCPMYFANATALVFGGKKPIDFGKNFFDGKRILGDGKTFEGTIAGMAAGTIVSWLLPNFFSAHTSAVSTEYLLFGILSTAGALAGDMAASFLKRRIGQKRGAAVPLLDQLDFVLGGLAFGSIVFVPSTAELATVLLLTIAMHSATNRIAFWLKIKNVPW